MPPQRTIGRPSTVSVEQGSDPSKRVRTCSTVSGCAARAALWMHDNSSAAPTTCSMTSGCSLSPNVPAISCWRRVRRSASEKRTRANELTPQEEQIARLALEGRTNPEIGAQAVYQRPHDRMVCARCSRSSASPHAEGCPDVLSVETGAGRLNSKSSNRKGGNPERSLPRVQTVATALTGSSLAEGQGWARAVGRRHGWYHRPGCVASRAVGLGGQLRGCGRYRAHYPASGGAPRDV